MVRERMHWVAAEATATAAALAKATGETTYDDWYRTWWDHIASVFIDDALGSWRHELDAGNRPSGRPGAGRPQSPPAAPRRNHVIPKEGRHSKISNIVCENFAEEISCEPQAHKFLWEFFD